MNKKKVFKKVLAVSAGLAAFLVGGTATLYTYGAMINNALQIPTSMIVPQRECGLDRYRLFQERLRRRQFAR